MKLVFKNYLSMYPGMVMFLSVDNHDKVLSYKFFAHFKKLNTEWNSMEPTTVRYICLAGYPPPPPPPSAPPGLKYILQKGLKTRPPPPSLCVVKAGRNLLNEEITPLLPTGIDERCCQTISN